MQETEAINMGGEMSQDEAREFMLAIADKSYSKNLKEGVAFSGKAAMFGGVAGFLFGFFTKRGLFASTCIGAFAFGGVAYLVTNVIPKEKLQKFGININTSETVEKL